MRTLSDKQKMNLLPVELALKKCSKKFFRDKENCIGQKLSLYIKKGRALEKKEAVTKNAF